MNETLTLSLSAGTIMADMATAEDSFDGETVKIGLRKVSR